MRILLVDDDNFSRKLMGMYLKGLEAETVLLPGGQECLDSVAEQTPDIILMDCQMPDMDGFETVTHLRQRGYQGIVLALTANSDDATLKRCSDCGMNGHISKPVNAATLQERILSALSSSGLSPGGSKPQTPESVPTSTVISAPAAPEGGPPNPCQHDPLERLRGLTMASRNTSLFNRLIASFLKSIDEAVDQMRDALAKSDAEGLSAAAHRIRGSAGSFGAAEFSDFAGALEDRLVESPFADCKQQAEELVQKWGPLRSYLENAGGTQ